VSGEVFNVACGDKLSLNEVVGYLREIIEDEGNITYGPPRTGDVPHSLADISQAQTRLRYEPLVSVKEGLEKVVMWFKDVI
tara:strand:+ start:361 stop:603 length:243 start_codon:yes stop_codon:yes gene_type:complete